MSLEIFGRSADRLGLAEDGRARLAMGVDGGVTKESLLSALETRLPIRPGKGWESLLADTLKRDTRRFVSADRQDLVDVKYVH